MVQRGFREGGGEGVAGSRESLSESFSIGAGRAFESVGTASLEGRGGPRRGSSETPRRGGARARRDVLGDLQRGIQNGPRAIAEATLVDTRHDVSETSSGRFDRRWKHLLQAPRTSRGSACDGRSKGPRRSPVDGAPASPRGRAPRPSTTARGSPGRPSARLRGRPCRGRPQTLADPRRPPPRTLQGSFRSPQKPPQHPPGRPPQGPRRRPGTSASRPSRRPSQDDPNLCVATVSEAS